MATPWAASFYKKSEQKRCIFSLHLVYSSCFVGIIIHVICFGILIKVLVQMQETPKMASVFSDSRSFKYPYRKRETKTSQIPKAWEGKVETRNQISLAHWQRPQLISPTSTTFPT